MRATRAYLAGLGTAGTLVLAASILFVLGSAVVTYNGWPKLGAIASPATQTLTAHPRAGSHASSSAHGLAPVKLVKPRASHPAGLPAAVANKRSSLLAQVSHSSVGHSAARRSTTATISHPVAVRQPTRSSAPPKTGSGSGSSGSPTGSGSTSTGTGTGTVTVTTPAAPVVATPAPVVSTPSTPVSSGSGGSSGSSGGSGSGTGSGTVTTVIKPGGTVTPPISVGTHPSGTPVVQVSGGSSGGSPRVQTTTTTTATTATSTTSTTSSSTSTTSTTGIHITVNGNPAVHTPYGG